MNKRTREVWKHNVDQELGYISELAASPFAAYISVDTEFPGFVYRPPLGTSEDQLYAAMKRNVDMMKPIQLGFTFYTAEGQSTGFSWQINFREFDPAVDPHAGTSIQLLKQSGIDFEKNRRDGVDAMLFAKSLCQELILPCHGKTRWVTFHGIYDLGYVVKLLTGLPLPDTLPEFLYLVKTTLGYVYDVKHIARFYGFDEKIGLVKMADTLDVSCVGQKHQAGYDSMITGLVFWKIKEIFGVDEDEYEGIMFGVEQCGLVQKMKMKMYQHDNRASEETFGVDEDEYEGIMFGAEQCGLVQKMKMKMYQHDNRASEETFGVDEDEYEGIMFGAEQCGLVQTTMYQCYGAQMVAWGDFAPSSYFNPAYSNLVVNYVSEPSDMVIE